MILIGQYRFLVNQLGCLYRKVYNTKLEKMKKKKDNLLLYNMFSNHVLVLSCRYTFETMKSEGHRWNLYLLMK